MSRRRVIVSAAKALNLTPVHVRLTDVSATRAGRRTPVQRRSRERVAKIMAAAERIVVEDGVDALSTREVARRTRIPVASLYQYFADREAIIAALIERHISSMDERIAAALAELHRYSIRTIVEATVAAYRAAYRARPSYVVLWFQGRLTAEIADFIRERDALLAVAFHRFARDAGLLAPGTDVLVLELAFELADRFLEVAYRHELGGDDRVVAEGIEVVVAYLESHATQLGIDGLDVSATSARWERP
jgi:AcrR family transcriptional regulator